MSASVKAQTDSDHTNYLAVLFGENIRILKTVGDMANGYAVARLLRHLVIDDLFASHVLEPLPGEIARARSHQWLHIENESIQSVDGMRPAVDLGVAGSHLVKVVHSAAFLYFLSETTAIWQLLPDPYLHGCGYGSMKRGDVFPIHSDGSEAYETG